MSFGVFVIVFFAGLSASAFYFALKSKWGLSISTILLLGLLLRIAMSLDGFLHPWDERYHALVAKNMIENPFKPQLIKHTDENYNYKDWTGNAVWLHKPPMSLWLIALSLKSFGISEFSVRIPSIVLSSLSILLIFFIGKTLFTVETGVLAAYLFAINGYMLDQSSGRAASDHIDSIFIFFSLASIYLILKDNSRKQIYLAGVLFGFALLTKSFVALIIPAVWLSERLSKAEDFNFYETFKDALRLVFPGLLLFLPWQIYTFTMFPKEAQWESTYNFLHFTEVLEGHIEPWHYYADILRVFYNETIYFAFGYFIYTLIKNRNWHWISTLVWFLIPLLVFSFSSTKMPGYLDACAAAIFLIVAKLPVDLLMAKKRKWLGYVVLLAVLTFAIRFSTENIDYKTLGPVHQPDWSKKLKAGEFLEDHEIEYLFYQEY